MSSAVPTLSHSTRVLLTDMTTAGLDELVTGIAELLVRNDAAIDPDLIVVEREGHLALATSEVKHGEPFISLPTQVLVPIDGLVWDDESDQVRLTESTEPLTSVQSDLLDLHIALWNTSDKLATFRATHPRAATLEETGLRRAIARIRPSFTPGDTPRDMLRTRTFTLRAGDSSSSVIMPLLELANHHPHGAPYRVDNGRLGANYSFIDDTGLTYVHYGPHRDAFDLACLYGYATDFTTFFVSAPMSIDLQDFGALTIERSVQRRGPAIWRIDEGDLRVSYLLLDARNGLFEALHRPVRDFLLARGASKAQALSVAIAAAETILQVNLQCYMNVITEAERVSHPGAATISIAAAHQRHVIDVIGELA